VAGRLDVVADLDFEVEVPGRAPVRGSLRGSGGRLELRVDDPTAFAGRGDSDAVRGLAAALAARGLRVTVVADDRPLLAVGEVRSSWLQRKLTGSRHMRIGGARGAWTGLRARAHAPNDAVLPDSSLSPPTTLTPLAPTFLRLPRRPVTTTHDPGAGGNPRLILAPRPDPWPGDEQPVFALREGTSTIGSSPECDIRLPGLLPVHAEVRHDADDEYVVVHLGRGEPLRVNGEPVRQRILRTASRLEVGGWTLTYYREEYADHGRPYGGRIGGELGHQLPQPPRHRLPSSPGVPQGEV
jgi:hypothetical protein